MTGRIEPLWTSWSAALSDDEHVTWCVPTVRTATEVAEDIEKQLLATVLWIEPKLKGVGS